MGCWFVPNLLLTLCFQEAFINLAKQAEEDGFVFENEPDLTLRVSILIIQSSAFISIQ